MKFDISTCRTNKVEVEVDVEDVDGIVIASGDGSTAIAWLIHDEGGKPSLYVYGDVESEEATHKIDLSSHVKFEKRC
jgi:glutamine amidotransferase PdxT